MFAIIVSVFTLALMFVVGAYSEVFRKLVDLIVRILYATAQMLGIKVGNREGSKRVNPRVAKQFKGVTKMKKSKENAKPISSISYFGLVLLVFGLVCFLLNMDALSGGMITTWVASWGIEYQQANTIVTVTSTVSMTFGLSMVWGQWRLASSYRKEVKRKKVKKFVKRELTEQEMLSIVEEKIAEEKNDKL